MEYTEKISGLGFCMRKRPNSKAIIIYNWDNLLLRMVDNDYITIWRKRSFLDFPKASTLFTNSTPKLRRLWAGKPVPFLKCIMIPTITTQYYEPTSK